MMSENESLTFLKKFILNHKSIGSIIPSSRYLSRKLANIVDDLEDVDILELGAGTGSLTNYIQHKNPTLVEYDRDLYEILKKRFKTLSVLNSCAMVELLNLEKQTGIVLSIPLVNNPIKEELVGIINKQYLAEKIKWCVMYTYSLSNPLIGSSFVYQKREACCLFNIPPAYIWVYR